MACGTHLVLRSAQGITYGRTRDDQHKGVWWNMRISRMLVAVVALVVLAGCGTTTGSNSSAQKPTVRIGSTNFGEQIMLAELYGQVLEANGYKVERRFNLGQREIVEPALEKGEIDMYPEYLATMTAFVTKDPAKASTDPAATSKNLQEALKAKGITVLDYAPAIDAN